MGKKKVIKKFEMLSEELLALVKEAYPDGFEDDLISFQTPKGELALGVPLETEEIDYLIKMPTDAVPEVGDDDNSSRNESNSSEAKEFVDLENLEIADEASTEDD